MMKKGSKPRSNSDMLDEYDFSKGVRGKYVKRLAGGSNIVMLQPEVAAAFHGSDSVNEALFVLIKISNAQKKKSRCS